MLHFPIEGTREFHRQSAGRSYAGRLMLKVDVPETGGKSDDGLVTITITAPADIASTCAAALETLIRGGYQDAPPLAGQIIEMTYIPDGPALPLDLLTSQLWHHYENIQRDMDSRDAG
jgi:hypothetical protein